MILPTHILTGMMVGAFLAVLRPVDTAFLVLSGGIGGAVPDIDMLVGEHRKTLHAPVLYPAAGKALLLVGVLWPAAVLPVAAFVLAAGVHSITDVFGGGKELRPWEEYDDRAVYSHAAGGWLTARRWYYAGDLKDAGVAGLTAAVLLSFGVVPGAVVSLALLAGVSAVLMPYLADRIPDTYPTLSSYLRTQVRTTLSSGRS